MGAASIIASSLFAHPRQDEKIEKPTFSVSVDVVNVFVTVRDKKGNLIRDLSQEDFTVKEDGRVQNIQYFARESDLPLTIGLIVDTTPSEANMLGEERSASRVFFEKTLRPGKDQAFVIQYAHQIEVVQYLTSSRDQLIRSLDRLQSHPVGIPPDTILGEAIYLTSEELMNILEGRKALIVLGDGGHVGRQLDKAVRAAQMADTLIYGILIYDKSFQGTGGWGYDRSRDIQNLRLLSKETGGTYFEVTGKNTLERIYGMIEEELRSQYNLGYVPDDRARSGFRRIKVDVKKKGLVVHARRGYFAGSKKVSG